MKESIGKHLFHSIVFGIIMAIIGFFSGQTTFTFPPVWLEWLQLFFSYTLAFLLVSMLFEWIYKKRKKD